MRKVTFARYRLLDERTGNRYKSRWSMTMGEALERDPGATVVPGTSEMHWLPETQAERDALFTPYGPSKAKGQ
jgi:hypothetical protein